MLIEGSCSLRELQERGQCAAVFDCVRLAHHLHRAKNHLSWSTPISRLKWAGLENPDLGSDLLGVEHEKCRATKRWLITRCWSLQRVIRTGIL